jgi:neutral ceramidase
MNGCVCRFGVVVGMVLGLVVSGPALFAAELRAGAATIEITPTEPVPMWGYGSRHAAPSTGTADPLLAKAVVLAVGDTKLAIVGLDLGRSPTEAGLQRIRETIKAKAGIEHSLIAGSHTHHGPVVELCDEPGRGKERYDAAVRYAMFLEEQIAKVILEADSQLVPAIVGAGSRDLVGFNRNRHSKREPIPVDRRLGVLRVDSVETGKPLAVLVNFTAHPTSIPDETMTFSADYIGSLRTVIEEKLGGTAIFMQGASGDLSTDRSGQDHTAYGAAIGREAADLASSLAMQPVKRPSLKVREERFDFASRVDFKNPLIVGVYSLAFFPELVANFVAEYAEGIRPRITVAVLNNSIALVGGSGEFFCQHAMRLRERARVDELFFFGYCNGYHQYFPTIEGAAEGGYGADTQVAPAEVGAGETMMNAALEWIFALQGAL